MSTCPGQTCEGAAQAAGQTFCCGPCAKGQHDRCLSSQPCDCPGCQAP